MTKLNALKHGLLCKEVLLRNEDAETLTNLSNSLYEEIKPVGTLEVILLERVIVNLWRLKRIIYVERDTMEYERIARDIYFRDKDLETSRDMIENDTVDKVLRYETSIEKGLYRALHELERLQTKRLGGTVLPPAIIDVEVSGANSV